MSAEKAPSPEASGALYPGPPAAGASSTPRLLRAWKVKVAVTACILAYYIAGYFSLNRIPFGDYHDVPRVPVLDDVPLIPWTILVYNSVFILGALGIWLLPDAGSLWRYLLSVILSYTVNYVFFAVYPTRIDRVPLIDDGSLWLWGMKTTRLIDTPHTCFPSLHITNCVLATLGLWGTRLKWWLLAWTLAISVSTLTTSQHVFLDLPAGAAVAFLGRGMAEVLLRRSCR
jgi:hypothetical protein